MSAAEKDTKTSVSKLPNPNANSEKKRTKEREDTPHYKSIFNSKPIKKIPFAKHPQGTIKEETITHFGFKTFANDIWYKDEEALAKLREFAQQLRKYAIKEMSSKALLQESEAVMKKIYLTEISGIGFTPFASDDIKGLLLLAGRLERTGFRSFSDKELVISCNIDGDFLVVHGEEQLNFGHLFSYLPQNNKLAERFDFSNMDPKEVEEIAFQNMTQEYIYLTDLKICVPCMKIDARKGLLGWSYSEHDTFDEYWQLSEIGPSLLTRSGKKLSVPFKKVFLTVNLPEFPEAHQRMDWQYHWNVIEKELKQGESIFLYSIEGCVLLDSKSLSKLIEFFGNFRVHIKAPRYLIKADLRKLTNKLTEIIGGEFLKFIEARIKRGEAPWIFDIQEENGAEDTLKSILSQQKASNDRGVIFSDTVAITLKSLFTKQNVEFMQKTLQAIKMPGGKTVWDHVTFKSAQSAKREERFRMTINYQSCFDLCDFWGIRKAPLDTGYYRLSDASSVAQNLERKTDRETKVLTESEVQSTTTMSRSEASSSEVTFTPLRTTVQQSESSNVTVTRGKQLIN